jgi:hypothetical protein
MSEYLILPDAFIRYVVAFRRLPVPIDSSIADVQSIVETVCLDASVEIPLEHAPDDSSSLNVPPPTHG